MTKWATLFLMLTASTAIASDPWLDEVRELPGVVFAVGFDTEQELTAYHQQGSGSVPAAEYVTDISVEGGAMKLTMPSNMGPSSSSWRRGFPAVDEGDSVSVQWKQRINAPWTQLGGSGPKQLIMSGDRTCDNLEFTMQAYYGNRFPITYTECGQVNNRLYWGGGNASYYYHWPASMPIDPVPKPEDFTPLEGEHVGWLADKSKSKFYVPDTWMTFQMQVIIGDWRQPNSTMNVWMAYEGEPLKQISHNPKYNLRPGSNPAFDQITLTSYTTSKKATRTHPVGYTWYDNVIVRLGEDPIPDPFYAVPVEEEEEEPIEPEPDPSLVDSVTITIVDDDEPEPVELPTCSLSVDQDSITEAGGVALIRATLSDLAPVDVLVTLAYSGTAEATRYNAETTIAIPAGQLSAATALTAIDNDLDEEDVTVVASIASLTEG